jgi:hypothetical protein
MYKIIFSLLFLANSASAAKLEDVEVLAFTPTKESITLKLHASQGPPDSYFTVDLTRTDPNTFDKLNYVMKKLENKKGYKLSLNIRNFSMSPSGSSYKSESVVFSGTDSVSEKASH